MALGPEQRIDPADGGELIVPTIDRDSSQLAQVAVGATHSPIVDVLSFDQLSGEDAWHQSLVYPA
jgi:hypothetical protein